MQPNFIEKSMILSMVKHQQLRRFISAVLCQSIDMREPLRMCRRELNFIRRRSRHVWFSETRHLQNRSLVVGTTVML